MHIVLVEPDIHWNTGNIGRTCVATETTLHLVGKLGFSLDDKQVRRAGLDYWPKLRLIQHKDFESFLDSAMERTSETKTRPASLLLFSTKAKKSFWEAPYESDSYLIFGSETRGLSDDILERFSERLYRIPVSPDVRSLNLSNAAAIALYEGLRRKILE